MSRILNFMNSVHEIKILVSCMGEKESERKLMEEFFFGLSNLFVLEKTIASNPMPEPSLLRFYSLVKLALSG